MYLHDSCLQAIEMAGRMEQRAVDLKTLGAPSDLLKRAQRAHEMMRHDLSLLAEVASVRAADRTSGVVSSTAGLYTFATENAVDGCCGEFYLFQCTVSRVSEVPALGVLTQMVERAQGYAELCWDINDWCLSQLSPQRGRNIRAAQHDAVHRLAESATAMGQPATDLKQLELRIDRRVAAA